MFVSPSGEQPEIGRRFRVAKKKITTDNIIHVSSVEFHEEFNGTTPRAVKVGLKNAPKKNAKFSQKWAKTRKKTNTLNLINQFLECYCCKILCQIQWCHSRS